MADVVRKSTQHMTDADLQAVAVYLQSLPPRAPVPAATTPFKRAAGTTQGGKLYAQRCADCHGGDRSEEHTSELQALMRISYAVFCLKKNTKRNKTNTHNTTT